MKVEELVVSEILDMVFGRMPQYSLDELKAGTYQRNNNLRLRCKQNDLYSDSALLFLTFGSLWQRKHLQLDIHGIKTFVTQGMGYANCNYTQKNVFKEALFAFSEVLNKSDLEPLCDLISDWYECFDWESKTTDVFRLHDLTKSRIQQLNQE